MTDVKFVAVLAAMLLGSMPASAGPYLFSWVLNIREGGQHVKTLVIAPDTQRQFNLASGWSCVFDGPHISSDTPISATEAALLECTSPHGDRAAITATCVFTKAINRGSLSFDTLVMFGANDTRSTLTMGCSEPDISS